MTRKQFKALDIGDIVQTRNGDTATVTGGTRTVHRLKWSDGRVSFYGLSLRSLLTKVSE